MLTCLTAAAKQGLPIAFRQLY